MNSIAQRSDEIIHRITVLMKQHDLHQGVLAERSGISVGTLNRILNKKMEMKPNTLEKIAKGLGIDYLALIEAAPEPSSGKEIDGFIEYDGTTTRIKSLDDLRAFVVMVEKSEADALYVAPPPARKQKAIIIDMDNTLLDTSPLEPFYDPIRKSKRGSQEQKAAWAELFRHIPDCKMYEGMQEVWDYIKQHDIKMCLVSNSPSNRIDRIVKTFNIPVPVAYRVGRYTCRGKNRPVMKPSPEPILKALEIMDETPNNAIVFGNAPDDIKAARGAGVSFVGCQWGNKDATSRKALLDENPPCVIKDPKLIISLICEE